MKASLDPGALANVASVISAFGAAMIFFRIQREEGMRAAGERVWLPVADWLLIAATMLCLLLVIIPLALSPNLRLPTAASGTAAILVAGYIFAIMAHYRIIFGARKKGPRDNPEPMELVFTCLTGTVALAFFLWRMLPPSN